MRVIGMMSGTSADGIDVALVRISGAPPSLSAKLEGHHHVAFQTRLREDILRLANGGATTTAEISGLISRWEKNLRVPQSPRASDGVCRLRRLT